MRFSCKYPVIMLVGAAAIIALLATTGQVPVPADPSPTPSPGLSEEWLLAGVITDAHKLSRLANENLLAVDSSSDTDTLLRHIGQMLHNPTLSGVDLSKPVRFFYLNPRKYQNPRVYQFTVSNEAELRQAIKPPEEKEAALRLLTHGTQATACFDPQAGQALLHMQKTRPKEMVCRGPGQLCLRANIQQILQVYEAEIADHARQMKARMRDAMSRAPARPDGEQEIVRWRQELEAALAALGQVREAEGGLDLARDHATVSLRVEPIPGSTLAQFIASMPAGSLELLRRCPNDAILLLTHNLQLTATMRDMILRQIGFAQLIGLWEEAKPSIGQTALALFATGDPESRIEVLKLTTGGAAEAAGQRWKKLSDPAAETPLQPIVIRPFGPDQQPLKGLIMAEVIPNEQALGVAGTNAMHLLLGPKILAAQEAGEGRSMLVVGRNPLPRIQQVRQLATDDRTSLRYDPAFVGSLEGIPDKPNLFVYVSPKGVWQWLMLAGVSPDALSPIQTGLAGGARFSADGTITAALRVPLRPMREALSSQRKTPPQNAPGQKPKP